MVIGPTLVLDQQRCVLCDRCVRFLRDVAGDEAAPHRRPRTRSLYHDVSRVRK